ncbi:hypothetical protein B0H14DRAFT_3506927 [Mycena olivaceomarginata]|nr:hypothetical protein B0H14DRAFT_3506927 [Mycena olivaceomarginata]
MDPAISSADFLKIQDELVFVAENDEHGDIARGDAVVDESLVDEVLNLDGQEEMEDEEQSSPLVGELDAHGNLVSPSSQTP